MLYIIYFPHPVIVADLVACSGGCRYLWILLGVLVPAFRMATMSSLEGVR